MTDKITGPEGQRRNAALSEAEKLAAIEASPNVIGFGRMVAREQQVARSVSFRKPQKPDGVA